MNITSSFSEEENTLSAKYHKLKKRKKTLQLMKTPKPEVEKPICAKRKTDARDAREVARKLIRSGAIPAIQKQITKQDQITFKRPKGQERKRSLPEPGVAAYQPFSSTQNDVAQETISEIIKEDVRMQDLYQHFASERDREERGFTDKNMLDPTQGDKPRAGNTIFVSGNKVTEDFLKKTFNDFGTIVNVSMEIEKGRGFITFAKPESADRAIAEMHSKSVNGINLQVQLARRQPQIEPINDAPSSAVWSTIAASKSLKGCHKDRRELVQYDEDLFLSAT